MIRKRSSTDRRRQELYLTPAGQNTLRKAKARIAKHEERFKSLFTPAELDALLAAGVPAGPINGIDEVFADAQVQARHMVSMLRSRDGEAVPTVRAPLTMTGLESPALRAAPRLGQHQLESWSR